MPLALRGSLLSHDYAEARLAADFAGRLGEASREVGRRAIRRALGRAGRAIGPASPVTAVTDVALVPVFTALGFDVQDIRRRDAGLCTARLELRDALVAGLVVAPWAATLDQFRRHAVAQADACGAEWAIVSNGRSVRLVDSGRAFARAYLEVDLSLAVDDRPSFDAFWALFRGEALAAVGGRPRSLAQEIFAAAESHGIGVCRSLREGVLEALNALLEGALERASGARVNSPPSSLVATLHDECLTIVYRVLFLLFAEARALVPLWHPLFREGYSIDALRRVAESPGEPRGLWESLRAVCRLANRGCRADDLVVTPFNGRLFAADRTTSTDRFGISDVMVRSAIVALSSRPDGRTGRQRVGYADLGVEQLGVVYESLLDYVPAVGDSPARSARGSRGRVSLEEGSGRRKATGSFYTPRAITEYLVRRTLHPLVHGRSADAILDLRILDPAMGSGAFLVAACRYLASAYETALLAEGRASARDLDREAKAECRRLVAQRCLYGVDLSPMAVQLASLSLWLATLAADRPLSFLDHHLRIGDSLIGASLGDLARQPPGSGNRRRPAHRLPLFDSDDLIAMLKDTVPFRRRLEIEPDETAEIVHAKERLLARLAAGDSPLARWKRVADAWCAVWFWKDHDGSPPPTRAFADLAGELLRHRSALPPSLSSGWLRRLDALAREHHFFHWTLEFPEVFYEQDGRPRINGGFDAVLGNPPWDMLRTDDAASTYPVRAVSRFVRDAGIYRGSGGHVNFYQLFIERALGLVRSGGRLGLVVPSGLAIDHGATGLRRALLDQADTDSIVGFDNRGGIFPVHRSLRFLLWTTTAGRQTTSISCRMGQDDPAILERLPDTGDGDKSSPPVVLSRGFITRYSPDHYVIPHVKSTLDLRIVEKIVSTTPPLGDPAWSIRFSRELNATEDRSCLFGTGPGLPILEGKHLAPFAVDVAAARWFIREDDASQLVAPARTFHRARLGYRDVASATNALTLIAAIVPRAVLTTHSVFCLSSDAGEELQCYLCGMLNSYVANYLVRLRVSTHVTAASMSQLQVPRPGIDSRPFATVCRLTGRLNESRGADEDAHAVLQAWAARLYGLDPEEFSHVLETFPLVEQTRRAAALRAFELMEDSKT